MQFCLAKLQNELCLDLLKEVMLSIFKTNVYLQFYDPFKTCL